MVDGDELGAVWERGLHLNVVEHLGHTLHDIVAGQHSRPLTINSATVRPSRAPSRRWSVITATASGWFSCRPRACLRRASSAAYEISSRSCSCGVKRIVRDIATESGSQQRTRMCRLLRRDVLQPHLAAGDDAIVVVGDGDQPQLLPSAAVDRRRHRGDGARRDRAQEVGVVVDPDDVPATVLESARPAPETLARPSTMEQYTPPCTMPHGCSSLSLISNRARPPSGVSSMYSRPSSVSNPLPSPAATSVVTQLCLHVEDRSAAGARRYRRAWPRVRKT